MAAKRCATGRDCERLIKVERFFSKGRKGNLFMIGEVQTNYYRGKTKWLCDDNQEPCNFNFKDLISVTNQLM